MMHFLSLDLSPIAIIQMLTATDPRLERAAINLGGAGRFGPERHGYRLHPRAFAGNRPGTHKRKARGQRGHAARRAKRRA